MNPSLHPYITTKQLTMIKFRKLLQIAQLTSHGAVAPVTRRPSQCISRRVPAVKTTCQTSNNTGTSRRDAMLQVASLTAALNFASAGSYNLSPAMAFEDDPAGLCDDACVAKINESTRVTTASGLEYVDVVVGTGPSPPVGYQVTVNYVAMTPALKIFDSSVERKAPYDIRVGAGQVIPGLDEGIKSMKVGGLRRLYIPGELAFPKGLASAAGRPRVPPKSPVVFDVQLLLIPGLEDEE
jgi:peptidylprolyl isomerase